MDELKKDALALKDYIIKERRYFHSHPELGCHELERRRTSKKLGDYWR